MQIEIWIQTAHNKRLDQMSRVTVNQLRHVLNTAQPAFCSQFVAQFVALSLSLYLSLDSQ